MTRTVIESGKIIDTAEKGDGDDVWNVVNGVMAWAEQE